MVFNDYLLRPLHLLLLLHHSGSLFLDPSSPLLLLLNFPPPLLLLSPPSLLLCLPLLLLFLLSHRRKYHRYHHHQHHLHHQQQQHHIHLNPPILTPPPLLLNPMVLHVLCLRLELGWLLIRIGGFNIRGSWDDQAYLNVAHKNMMVIIVIAIYPHHTLLGSKSRSKSAMSDISMLFIRSGKSGFGKLSTSTTASLI